MSAPPDGDLDDNELVECDEHGATPATYVCRHVVGGSGLGFHSAEPSDENPTPDAWCDQCNWLFESIGGTWTEEAETQLGIQILCTGCYAIVRDRNKRSPLIPKRPGL